MTIAEAIKINPQLCRSLLQPRCCSVTIREICREQSLTCTEAIKINPQYAEAYYNRGVVRYAVRR